MSKTRKIINIVVAPLLVVLTILLAGKLVKARKPQSVKEPSIAIPSVSVIKGVPTSFTPTINTYGNTRSYLTTTLSSQVAGEILRLAPNFESGLSVAKGDWLVEINPADYQAALSERKASLANALQTLADEETRSQLAQEDWLASGRKLEDAADFTLRKPQLTAAKASVTSAEAAIAKATLDVTRTTIIAPFDAMVESRTASPGNVVSAGTSLGSLLARERIEVRLPLTPEQVGQLNLAGLGSLALEATLTTPTLTGQSWMAIISRVEPMIDPKNQTLWLIGEITEPFARPEAFLPVGAFVNASIGGEALEGVFIFPEVAVVEDAFVWVIGPNETLHKQPIKIELSQKGMIISKIANPVFSLPLNVAARPLASFKEGQTVSIASAATK
ncbi:MAG: RND family efflux transporter MFP subunit [Verrucomicrobiales bacterium]|jgi:RND family efflux transporter MFP subunit